MFNPLKGLGDLNEMRQKAQKMQALLQKEEVIIDKSGVKVVIRGDQRIISVEVDGVTENRIVDAINDGIKKTQEMAAKKLMEIDK